MKHRYRVFLREWGTYYCEDLVTKKQTTLKTRDKDEAYRLVVAKNETEDAPAFSLHLACVYWQAGDPTAAKRTWQDVMNEIPKLKSRETRHRWETAIKDKAFYSIRNKVVLETRRVRVRLVVWIRLGLKENSHPTAALRRIHGLEARRERTRTCVSAQGDHLRTLNQWLDGSAKPRPEFHLPRNGALHGFARQPGIQHQSIGELHRLTHVRTVALCYHQSTGRLALDSVGDFNRARLLSHVATTRKRQA